MIYTPYTLEAMRLSYAAHHGQLDRAGAPYIFHPFHLAERMKSEQAVCVALLHDVLEDTGLTERELAARFPEEVVRAVRLLTRVPGEDYFLYLGRIRENPGEPAGQRGEALRPRAQSRPEQACRRGPRAGQRAGREI